MKTMETTEEVSSDGMEKRVERRNWRQTAPCVREKPMADLKKVVANPWSGKKITKTTHAGRGQETKWEIPVKLPTLAKGHCLITSSLVVLVILTVATLTGCVSQPSAAVPVSTKQQELNFNTPPDMASVYVLRPGRLKASAVSCYMGLDSHEFGQLNNEDFIFNVVSPGDHELSARAQGVPNAAVHFRAETGRNYFFQVRMSWLSLKVEQLEDSAGLAGLEKLKPENLTPDNAVSPGHWEIYKTQIEQGGRADYQDKNGLTPLFFAARNGDANATAFLISHGADVNHESKTGETPLMWAASGPAANLRVVLTSVDSALACSAAGTGDNLPTVIRLVEAGANINAKSKKGLTPVGIAALWGNSDIALWLYDRGADPATPDKECEMSGRLAQVLGDYFLAQDQTEKARFWFEKAHQEYQMTVGAVKAQLANIQLTQLLFEMAQFALAVAAQEQANIQAHQMAEVAALSRASQSGGGVTAYSYYFHTYSKLYEPTYNVGYMPPPDISVDTQTYYNEKIKYYQNMETFMGRVLVCFTNYVDLAELHGRIENLQGQSRSPYAFAIACVQQTARDYAAKSGNTNVVISPMELPDNLYGKQIESEIRFGESALWRLTIMSGWTSATQAQKGYDLNRPFLRITFIDTLNQQTGEIYFRVNQDGDKMTIVYTTNLPEPNPHAINGEYNLSDYESLIRGDLQRIIKAQLQQLEYPQPVK